MRFRLAADRGGASSISHQSFSEALLGSYPGSMTYCSWLFFVGVSLLFAALLRFWPLGVAGPLGIVITSPLWLSLSFAHLANKYGSSRGVCSLASSAILTWTLADGVTVLNLCGDVNSHWCCANFRCLSFAVRWRSAVLISIWLSNSACLTLEAGALRVHAACHSGTWNKSRMEKSTV